MQLVIFYFLLLSSLVASYTIKNFTCDCSSTSAQKYIYQNYSCTAVKYDPLKSSVVSGYFQLKEPTNKLFVTAIVDTKVQNKFIPLFSINDVDFCKEMSSISTSTNPIYEIIYKTVKKTVPELVHNCPYDQIKAENVTVDLTFIPQFLLQGEYRGKLLLYGSKEKNLICTVSVKVKMS
ncbi:hypothetical protein PVAND_000488 [Polypedilum vanderplanki]|uniref:MD-2-related lipid-recognition domain-containing protein n=1 Tax=Polypedilum vanderplanki TaxID=319348 RepID=A0A9J6BKD1_POLVA|nr:hypothetical protein PVAND_000488 [Polypedilum vanderplanki]